MFISKVYQINDDYLISQANSPDFNTIRIRAIETETIQTSTIKFYLLNVEDNSVVELLSLDAEEVETVTEDVRTVIENEIDNANSLLSVFGIDLSVELEILFPHDSSQIGEVPSISTYEDSFERETIDYLTYSEALVNQDFASKEHINDLIVTLKNEDLWDALDVISILCHNSDWIEHKVNKNLKVDVPGAWLNLYGGETGGPENNNGVKLMGNFSFINLGYQPFAPDFNLYFPNPQFTKDNASFLVAIVNTTGSGCIFRRGVNQDVLAYDANTEELIVNITAADDSTPHRISYDQGMDGVWCINRTDSTTVEIWHNAVLLTTFTEDSADFVEEIGYSSLGYGNTFDNALEGNYIAACIGRALTEEEITNLSIALYIYHGSMP